MTQASILKTPHGSNRQAQLDLYLSAMPDIAFEVSQAPCGHMLVDLLVIPERLRGQGLGRRIYELWENTLDEGVVIELFAVDADATAFWRALGFDGPFNSVMTKTVRRMAMAA